MDKYAQNKASVFGGGLLDVDQQTYGEGVPDNGAVVAKRLPILSISPDLRQPRRVVPHIVRGAWDGDPDDFISVLGNWHALVEDRLGHPLDLPATLRSGGDVLDFVDDPIVAEYAAAIKLAQTIFTDGQRESIEVWRRDPVGRHFVIQDGERRWVAHHLLNLHVSGDYGTILAVEKDRNVWAQATRNGAHRALNAIAMARQIALLLIAMYEGDSDVNFDSFERMVLPGECDRKYYAQVARGDLYPVKRGMLDRVLSVTGMKQRTQLAQYRALLDLDDDLWLQADTENWAEFAIRTRAEEDRRAKTFAAEQADVLPVGNTLSGNQTASEGVSGGQNPPENTLQTYADFQEGCLVLTVTGNVREVHEVALMNHEWIVETVDIHGGVFVNTPAELTRISDDTLLSKTQSAVVEEFKARRTAEEQIPAVQPGTMIATSGANGVIALNDLVLTSAGTVEKIDEFEGQGAIVRSARGYQRLVATDQLTRITDDTLLTAEQMDAVRALRGTPEAEQSPAHLLTPAERDALDRAWNVMHRADPRFKGWYPAPPYLPDATRNMVTRGFLETSRRALWGRAEETCLRITPEGSRALGRQHTDPDTASQPTVPADDLPKAKAPQFEYMSHVYHRGLHRVGQVRGSWRESKASPDGAINTDWVTVVVLGGWGGVFNKEINWEEAHLRAATAEEVARWTGSEDDARGDEAKAGVETRQPDSATGGAVETGTRPAAGKVAAEETSPTLFMSWAGELQSNSHGLPGEFETLLRLLHTLASEPTKTRIQDLLTMTEDDLHELVEVTPVGTSPGGLNWLLTQSESQITELIGRAILKPLNDYVLHLRALGKDIDTDVRG